MIKFSNDKAIKIKKILILLLFILDSFIKMKDDEIIVCDNGTGFMKLGFAGEDFPRCVFPTLMGHPMLRTNEKVEGVVLENDMFGDEAARYRAMLEISHPIEIGIVKDWEGMEKMWRYGFNKLGITDFKNKRILLTEAAGNPKKNRELMAEVMLEKFGFQSLCIEPQALLALYCEARTTGIVLDSGDGVTHMIPVLEGYINEHTISRMNIAGRHITNYLIKLLLLRGYAFNSSADFETVREIKERLCFVTINLEADRKLARETTYYDTDYLLPDGNMIKVGRERFEAAECIFNPSLIDSEVEGVVGTIVNCIESCPVDYKRELYANLILSGGTTMFPGFPTRVKNDIKDYFKQQIKMNKRADTDKYTIKILDPPRRKQAVFIGGSVCAYTFKENEEVWVTLEKFKANPQCVHNIIGTV